MYEIGVAASRLPHDHSSHPCPIVTPSPVSYLRGRCCITHPHQGGCIMKTFLVLLTLVALTVLSVSLAVANPSLLPKHPGYPMGKALDPVKGQSLANDPGQNNAI